MKPFLQLILEN